jgi:hypothetical protein
MIRERKRNDFKLQKSGTEQMKMEVDIYRASKKLIIEDFVEPKLLSQKKRGQIF